MDMDFSLLNDIVTIFALAVVVVYICHRIKLPSIVGFLLTGIIAGPHGIGVIDTIHQVELLAEIGIIFLLFSIGIEFSFKNLMSIKKSVVMGGSIQVGLSVLMAFLIARGLGLPFNQALFLGFMVSLSSTAIVLKQLGERSELATPHGKMKVGILIYQDIIVVPMMLLAPILAASSVTPEPLGGMFLKGIGVMLLLLFMGVYILPRVLYRIACTQSRELFLLSIIVICFATAWLTNSIGLSLALGAFLAGLIISESEYSQQALSNILPFIDTFTSLFFVSIGMLLNVGVVLEHAGTVLVMVVALLVGKAIIAALAGILMGYPLRTAILVGFGLCQVGEFSFILSQSGLQYNLINLELYQGFLAAAIFTMMLTPFLMNIAPRVAYAVSKAKIPPRLAQGTMQTNNDGEGALDNEEHLIIVGYGLNGRNLSRAATAANIPYIILEINPDVVIAEKIKGEPIFFGDATQEMVLKHAGIGNAKIMVVAIHDAVACRRITAIARHLNPSLHIIVRTRFVADMEDLHLIGADEVIPEEYETSVEIFSRVLARYMVPQNDIEKFIHEIRSADYDMFRSINKKDIQFQVLTRYIDELDFNSYRIDHNSPVIGKTIAELDLRNIYGITVVAIRRKGQVILNPGGEEILMDGDYLVLLGGSCDIKSALQ